MQNEELNIVLSLTDKLTAQIGEATKGIQKFGQELKTTGATLQRAGVNMMFLGATITGPLAVAFKQASAYSAEVDKSLTRLSNITREFSNSVAISMIPVVNKIADIFGRLLDIWEGLSPKVRDTIVQFVLMAGIMLTLGGLTEMLIGRFFKLTGQLLQFAVANLPLLLVAGAVALIAIHLDRLKPAINAIEIRVKEFTIGFLISIEHVLWGLQQINEFFKQPVTNIVAARGRILEQISGLRDDINMIKQGSEGDMVTTIENLKLKFEELFNLLKTRTSEVGLQFKQTMDTLITAEFKQLTNVAKQTWNVISLETQVFSTKFGDAVARWIVLGEDFGKKMKAIFQDMAMEAIKWVIQLGLEIAKVLAMRAALAFLGFHEGGEVMHQGGMIKKAHSGMAIASDERLILAQTGEGILSRRGMAALGGAGELNRLNSGKGGGGGVTVYIQSASFRSEDDIQSVFERLSYLIQDKRRAAV